MSTTIYSGTEKRENTAEARTEPFHGAKNRLKEMVGDFSRNADRPTKSANETQRPKSTTPYPPTDSADPNKANRLAEPALQVRPNRSEQTNIQKIKPSK